MDYLRQEENDLPRAGAVAVAGVAGLILGLRGGFFRKLLYTSVAATGKQMLDSSVEVSYNNGFISGMAGLCYPQQAMEYSKDLLQNSRKYAAIGYNFVQGGNI